METYTHYQAVRAEDLIRKALKEVDLAYRSVHIDDPQRFKLADALISLQAASEALENL